MQKGVAGQKIGVQMVSASDGSAFTGSVTVYVTGDAGTQAIGSVGSGVCTHEGNGYHSYAPDQAETNYDLIAFTFVGSGAVPVTVQVYTAINPVTAPPTAATIADAVWDEATVDHTSTGSTGEALSLILTAVNTLTGRIPATLFSGITYLSRWLGAIAGKTADTTTRTEINATTAGAGYNETTDSQEAIRDRGDAAWITGGGSSSVTVAPLQATAPNRVSGTEIITYINDTSSIGPIVVTDGDGNAVDLSSYTLKICVERIASGTIDANITPTVSGAGNNQVTFTPTSACVNSTTPRKWSLRSTSDGQVFAFGDFTVEWPARLS